MKNVNVTNVFMPLFIQNNNEARLAPSTILYLAHSERFFEFLYADDLARVQNPFIHKIKTFTFYSETIIIVDLSSRISFSKKTHG